MVWNSTAAVKTNLLPSRNSADTLSILRLEGVEAGSPKSASRACQEAGLLQSARAEHARAMADDRDLSAHTSKEGLAEAILKRLPGHLATLEAWLRAMQNRLPTRSWPSNRFSRAREALRLVRHARRRRGRPRR
jgi:hypothetical protein